MRRLVRDVTLLGVLVTLGCAGGVESPHDGGGGGSGGGGAGGSSTGGVTYTKDVQPIFAAKCAPCHAGETQGHHNIATKYADAMLPVQSLDAPAGCFKDGFDRMMPKTVGECTLPAIMEGWMPASMRCFETPRPAVCVTTEQEAIIAAWIAAGMPQ